MLKATEISNTGVVRFDLARQLPGGWRYWTTAYLVEGTLVDSGCAHTASELLNALDDKHLDQIVNTHSHEDHIGGNGALQSQRQGLEILAHSEALPILEDPRAKQPLQPYRRVFWGWPEPSQAQPFAGGEIIESERLSFHVVHTPGHSPDHTCLYEPQRGWLFTGDLFVGGQDRALRIDYDIWGIIDSLKRIAALPIEWMFPGSARVRQNPDQEIREKIDYYEQTGERVLELFRQGKTEGEIAREMFGGATILEWITLGHFSRGGLVRSYLKTNVDE